MSQTWKGLYYTDVKFWIRSFPFRYPLSKKEEKHYVEYLLYATFICIFYPCFQVMNYPRVFDILAAEESTSKYSSWLGPKNSLISKQVFILVQSIFINVY